MKEYNLYWSVYKNLEKEFLELTNFIHFSDDQLKVYSMHIADLIVRCSIEIESISKELYFELGGERNPLDENGDKRDLYFDTDCLDLLENKWHITKKNVIVSAPTVYFSNESNRVFTPLHKANKRGSSGSKWKQAYQAVKHNRKESLKKATIENLMYAMGALYILNLYYKDETISIGRVYRSDKSFDSRAGSDIFSVSTYCATSLSMSTTIGDDSITKSADGLENAVYIIKYDDKSFKEMYENFCKDDEITVYNFTHSQEISEYIKAHPEYNIENINKACLDIGGMDLLWRIVSFSNTRNNDTKTEAILNKHKNIYPTLSK